jgi:hypothetical protein
MNKKIKEALKKIPAQGFIKTTSESNKNLNKEDKVALIRKGNEYFNNGKIDIAKKIFITTGYSDGLIRLGDYYNKKNKPFEALRMYYLAPDKKNADAIIEKMSRIVQYMLHEDEGKEGNNG